MSSRCLKTPENDPALAVISKPGTAPDTSSGRDRLRARGLFLTLLTLCSAILHTIAFARPADTQAPRKAIRWPTDFAYYAVSDDYDDYRYERACAEALSNFKDWPALETSTSECYD